MSDVIAASIIAGPPEGFALEYIVIAKTTMNTPRVPRNAAEPYTRV